MKINIPSFILGAGILIYLLSGCENKDKAPGPVTDIEGNIYKTVRIGARIWMAENLRTGTFNDGTAIPIVTDPSAWSNLTTPGYCWYNNDESANRDTFGALYNCYSAASGSLCPTGWHIPSKDDWGQLRDELGDTLTGGGKLKETGIIHWNSPNAGATNSSGFTALPAGLRYFEGTFNSASYFTSFWSSTEYDNAKGWYLSLYYNDPVASVSKASKKDGFSVRCVKD